MQKVCVQKKKKKKKEKKKTALYFAGVGLLFFPSVSFEFFVFSSSFFIPP